MQEVLLPVPELGKLIVYLLLLDSRGNISILRVRLVSSMDRASGCWSGAPLSHLSRFLLVMSGLLFLSLLVKSLVALDVFLFLLGLRHNLGALFTNAGLKLISVWVSRFFSAGQLLLKLFDSLLVVGVFITFW